jgi:tetratricopeptide (TPR) repeat protein
MKKNIQFVVALVALVVVACQSPKEKALQEIEALQVQDSVFSIENMAKEKDAYIAFADKYPDDERAPEFLFKAGQGLGAIASQKKDMKLHEESIAIFKRIQENYPKHHYAEEALFLSGFVYENHMGEIAKAKAQLAAAKAALTQADVDVKNAKLLSDNKVISTSELEMAKAKKDAILANIEEAEANLNLANINFIII